MRTWISFHSRRKFLPDSVGKVCWTITLWKPALVSPLLLSPFIPHKMFGGWFEGLLSLHETAFVPCTAQAFLLLCPQHPSNIKPSNGGCSQELWVTLEKRQSSRNACCHTGLRVEKWWSVSIAFASDLLSTPILPSQLIFHSLPSPQHRVRLLASHFLRFCCVIVTGNVKGARWIPPAIGWQAGTHTSLTEWVNTVLSQML